MTLLELAEEIGLELKRTSAHGGGEYHGSCPACRCGNDRFAVWPNEDAGKCVGRFWCRQCDVKGDSIQFCREFLKLSWEDAVKKVQAQVPERNSFSSKKKAIFRPIELQLPSSLWLEKASIFTTWTHQQLLEKPEQLYYLHARGLPFEAVKNFKLGWCPTSLKRSLQSWGIPSALDKKGNPAELWLSKGISIPTLDSAAGVVRIKIRRTDWKQTDEIPKYIAVKGSMNGLNIFGDTSKAVMIVTESEFDALSVVHAVGDTAFAVAVGSNNKNPDNVTHYLAQRKTLLICRDNDAGGKTMIKKWKELFLHAIDCPTPVGKDIGEAITEGLKLKEWLLDTLSKI